MKKIISFSLWGNDPKYCVGAIKNATLRNEIYPNWICRFYVHKDVSKETVLALKNIEGTEVIISSELADWTFTTERFKAIDDEDVSHVIFRDADSRLNRREAEAVSEWIEQDNIIHIMRDHPYHGSFAILAGMWGINKKKFSRNMESLLSLFKEQGFDPQYHYDQIFLHNYIWTPYYNNATVHDEFFSQNPFPSKRVGLQFVGQSFNQYDYTPPEHTAALLSV